MNAQTIEVTAENSEFTVSGNPVCFLGPYGLHGQLESQLQRVGLRQKTLGLMAIVFDGRSQYFCTVDDLSTKGLRLGQVPVNFDESATEYMAMVLTPYNDVRIALELRWSKETNRGMYKSIGFEIKTSPCDWQDFVFNLEAGNGDLFYLLAEDEMRGMQ